MPIQHCVNGADRRNPHLARNLANQKLSEFAGPSVRLLFLKLDDSRLHLERQLVAIAEWPAGAIYESFQTALFVTFVNLISVLRDIPNFLHK